LKSTNASRSWATPTKVVVQIADNKTQFSTIDFFG